MSRQIEQTLFSLMPSYGSDLPPSLVELAGSLLAQSRLKASTLKAEEEVARIYACANLACDRLKISLDLPPIQARPPIPPRIYKGLYAHLDHVLAQPSTPSRSRSGRVRTPRSKTLGHGTAEQRPLPSRGTPTKEQSLARFRATPAKEDSRTPTRSSGRQRSVATGASLQPWVMPVIRYICSETGQPKLVSSVVAGMDAITVPGGRQTYDEWIGENYTALLAAVYWWVTARARAATRGQETSRAPSLQHRREIISLLTQARKTVTVVGATGGDDPWEGWADLKPRDFSNAVTTVEQRSWLGDWWTGVDDVVRSTDWDAAEAADGEEADLAEPIRVRRADTMFQEKCDYLSEVRMVDFTAWKADMLARIGEGRMEGGAMEIDTQ